MSIEQGRNAEILESIIDGTEYDNTNPYPSPIETLLMELKEAIETGGGGDTTALAAKVNAIEAQLFSTIADVATNTDTGSMDLYSKNLNTITTSGFYNAMTCTNAPSNYCTLIVIGYYLAGYCTQIAMDVTTGKFYTRTQTNSTWGAWREKVNAADLAAVATSGAYSDLTGTPTIDSTPTEASTNPVQSGGVYTALDGKVDKVSGKELSTNDYTNADKTALGTLQTDVDSIKTELSRTVLASTDLNALTAAGNYTCNANSNTYTNAPSDLTTGTYTLLMVRATAGNRYFQIILSWTNPGDIYIRTLTIGTSPSATAWKKLTAVSLEG